VTLHDTWMFTGHCAYPGTCERFKVGCGSCPDLERYPAVSRDATADNFLRKRDIYRDSNIHLSAPSRWMMNQLEASALGSCFTDKQVIPNGIDTEKFSPGDRVEARKIWRLPENVPVLLYVARNARHSPYKDYATIESAAKKVAAQLDHEIHVLVLGEEAPDEVTENLTIHFRLTTDLKKIIAAYRSADVYLHAAAAENFPTTVLEAMACGLPVVATNIGGIPEQIEEELMGYLVDAGDGSAMADKILKVLSDENLLKHMGQSARELAVKCYDQSVMSDRYIEWYQKIIRE